MFGNYYQVRAWLESFIPQVYGKENLGLARIEELLRRLGNPEKKFKSIHIAGTSGKGSCAFYTSQILKESGYKVGLHISPHLIDIRERMQIFTSPRHPEHFDCHSERSEESQSKRSEGSRDSSSTTQNDKVIAENDTLMSMQRFLGLFNEIKPVVEQIQREDPDLTPSYFEILVAASFLYFAKEGVDYAVVEVGLGGKLDATNVLMPEVSVITNIGLDHTEILGNTVDAIAKEKAGIIKDNVPIVTAASGKALKVIEKVAKSKNTVLVKISTQDAENFLKSDAFSYIARQNDTFSYYPIEAVKTSVLLPLEVIKTLKIDVGEPEIQKVFDAKFPGRFEEIQKGIILDGAHNVEKIKTLINFLNVKFQISNFKFQIVLVIGFKRGKNWKEMVDLLIKNLSVEKVIATKYEAVSDTGRGSAVRPADIVHYMNTKYKIPDTRYYLNSHDAVFAAMNSSVILSGSEGSRKTDSSSSIQNDKALVLVTGSLYLVGEVREMLKFHSG